MPSARTVHCEYDAIGNRSVMIDPDGGRRTYTYDGASRLSSLVDPWGERTTFQYDALGRATLLEQANGTRATYTYDLAGNEILDATVRLGDPNALRQITLEDIALSRSA